VLERAGDVREFGAEVEHRLLAPVALLELEQLLAVLLKQRALGRRQDWRPFAHKTRASAAA
jgi:hypothetical protein